LYEFYSEFTLTNVPSGAVFTKTVYSHPASHPASIITQDASNRFVSDAEITTWNNKLQSTSLITNTIILGPDTIIIGESLSLTASGAFSVWEGGSSGLGINKYTWILPDNTEVDGTTLSYAIANNVALVGTIIDISLYATDDLGNISNKTTKTFSIQST